MYYESYLRVDLGDDPRRPRPARQLLRNLYLLHQRISEAFGRDPRREQDAKEKVPRSENPHWVLFRVMPATRSVLVRSAQLPDWDRAFRKHSVKDSWIHLSEPPSVRPVELDFTAGDRLRFSLRANPTVKRMRGLPNPKEDNGYRVSLCYPKYALAYLEKHGVAVSDEEGKAVDEKNGDGRELCRRVVERALIHWLERKGEAGGFEVEVERTIPIQEGFRHLWRPVARTRNGRRPDMSFRSVLYEGTLKVADATRFLGTLTSGIGPGKAFGFGLLSVAPYG